MQAPANPGTQQVVDIVGGLGGDRMEVVNALTVDFFLGDMPCLAYMKDGGSRIRGSVFLDILLKDPAEAEAWVGRQPQPESGLLEIADCGDGDLALRILFERSVDVGTIAADPLREEAEVYSECWHNRTDVVRTDGISGTYTPLGDPRDATPVNAWLLLGDEASFPSKEELLDDTLRGHAGIFESLWTTSKQTDVGDLLLIYFTAPRKAAHFVARAVSRAFFDREIGVKAEKHVADEQWWCHITPPIEIEPIPVATLRELAGGHLPLRGRSGVYLRPEVVAALPITVKRTQDTAALTRVFCVPIGRADLPEPETITRQLWSSVASGGLRLESKVEQYIVEPLLRLTSNSTSGTVWKKSFKTRGMVADYVILREGAPCCVIEVKLAVRESPNGDWKNSKDFQQVRRYADELGCRSALIDANRVYLIKQGAAQPHRIIERRCATAKDIQIIGTHFAGGRALLPDAGITESRSAGRRMAALSI